MLLALVMSLVLVPPAESARVLMVAPISGKSLKELFYGLGSALADSGHEVVFLNAFKPSEPVPGIREVVPDALAAVFADGKFPNVFRVRESGTISEFHKYKSLFFNGPQAILRSQELDQLLTEKFDLVVLGPFAYSMYFVPFVLEAPFIFLTPLPHFPILSSPLGNPTLPALSPMPFVAASDRMTFTQRLKNMASHLFFELVLRRLYASYADQMVAERFGAGVMPPALELERNVSLALLISSPVLNYHRPLLPNAVEVGGMHCRAPRPLPHQLTDFLGETEQFVYFSLGSLARPEDMPAAQRADILSALGALPYKVLLKWDTEERTGMPRNVLPSKWLPQQDVLGSGRCRLFVTQGGVSSLLESVCHAVPMLVMPLFGDQPYNAISTARLGTAETLAWDQLTPQSLQEAIGRALAPERLTAARHRQQLMREQPVSPRQLAVHWAEHVIRHGGAPHLRSVGAELNFLQYYSLDVMAFLLVVLLLVLWLLVLMVKLCWRCVRGSVRGSREEAARQQAGGRTSGVKKRRDGDKLD